MTARRPVRFGSQLEFGDIHLGYVSRDKVLVERADFASQSIYGFLASLLAGASISTFLSDGVPAELSRFVLFWIIVALAIVFSIVWLLERSKKSRHSDETDATLMEFTIAGTARPTGTAGSTDSQDSPTRGDLRPADR